MTKQNCYIEVDVKDELPPTSDVFKDYTINVIAIDSLNRCREGYFELSTKVFIDKYFKANREKVPVVKWLKKVDDVYVLTKEDYFDISTEKNKVFHLDEIRSMVNELLKEEMTLSKFCELLNVKAKSLIKISNENGL